MIKHRKAAKTGKAQKGTKAPIPSREEILAFIQESPVPVGKKEIARAFHVRGDDRIALKLMLKEMESNGQIERGQGRRMAPPSALPEVLVLEVSGFDTDGEIMARPLNWTSKEEPPAILVNPGRRGHPPLAVGDRLLGKLKREPDGTYDASIIRTLDREAKARVLGVYEPARGGGRLRPTDKREKKDFMVTDAAGAQPGELVLAELLPSTRHGLKSVKVVERLGHMGEARSISLISIHTHELPTVFPDAARKQAEDAKPPVLGQRTDLRDIPLVTIDGADARDFDDAVFAEPDDNPDNPGGWHLLVAIADVAHYVPPGSPLDRAAFERGNSAYFPDRVVPMLPEELSNELCSLKPNVDRACMAVHMWIDHEGTLKRHRFVRGLMRSAARLTYEQVQEAFDGNPNELTAPLLEPVIRPLYTAYRLLLKARERRGTLELDLPERQVRLAPDGQVVNITMRARYDSHKLIEEFMIAANVAAAEALEARGQPCMYRVHDRPADSKLEALREFLKGFNYSLPKGDDIRPRNLTQILEKVSGKPEAELINQVVLRSQAQAVYSPDNLGHFGLALQRYAHFTSPIRRYADLVVHRALIRGYNLGDGVLSEEEAGRMEKIGEHISVTERRAATAERDAIDRYVAAYLANRVGGTFSGRVGGVTRFGLFVTLDETGADGIVPIATLPDDWYDHDEVHHCLTGRRRGRVYRLGARVKVSLVEADPISGSMVFALQGEEGADPLEGSQDGTRPHTNRGARAKVTSRNRARPGKNARKKGQKNKR